MVGGRETDVMGSFSCFAHGPRILALKIKNLPVGFLTKPAAYSIRRVSKLWTLKWNVPRPSPTRWLVCLNGWAHLLHYQSETLKHLSKVWPFLLILCLPQFCEASRIGFLVDEPAADIGNLVDRAGHILIYFSDICADGPSKARPCQPGEGGSVLQRDILLTKNGLNWIISPAAFMISGTLNLDDQPVIMTPALVDSFQKSAYSTFFHSAIPPEDGKAIPDGNWKFFISANAKRNQYLMTVADSDADNASIIQAINSEPTTGHPYNLFWRNCATEVQGFMNMVLPESEKIGPGVSTMGSPQPLGMAKGLIDRGRKDPNLDLKVEILRQSPSLFMRSQTMIYPLQNMYKNFIFAGLVPWWPTYLEVVGAVFVYYEIIRPFSLRKQEVVFADGASSDLERQIAKDREAIKELRSELKGGDDSARADQLDEQLKQDQQDIKELQKERPAAAAETMMTKKTVKTYRAQFKSLLELAEKSGKLPDSVVQLISKDGKVGKHYKTILKYLQANAAFTGDVNTGGAMKLTLPDEMNARSTSLSLAGLASGYRTLAVLVLVAALDYDLDGKNYPELKHYQSLWNALVKVLKDSGVD